jgi:hypothetical protein
MRVTAFADAKGMALGVAYYNKYKVEPIVGAVEFAEIHGPIQLVQQWTVTNLLDRIIARAAPRSNIMLLSHGSSGGLSIAFNNSLGGLGVDAIRALGEVEKGLSNEEIQQRFTNVPPALIRGIVERAKKVRALNLGAIVIRACNLGRYDAVLLALKAFFGAVSIEAPKLFDFYSNANPGAYSSDPGRWAGFRSTNPTTVVYGSPPNRLALAIRDNGVEALAESQQAVRNFLAANFPPIGAAGLYQKGHFPLHGLVNGQRYFPNDLHYREQLKRV